MADIQLSTYREQQVTILPGQTFTVQFSDTMPNHYYINNLSTSDVYLGITMLPNTERYDLYIGPSEQKITGRDKGTQQIYLYNDSPNPAAIMLTTFTKAFDPTILISASAQAGTASRPSSNVITGFTAPLPNGSNKVGRVDVESLPELPEGDNVIGKVIIPEPVIIGSMPPIEVTNDPVRAYHHMFDGPVSTTEVIVDCAPRNMTRISYIINDDETNDLYVAFNEEVLTSVPGNGYNGVIRLKPGESLTDLNRMSSKVKFLRAAGNGTVRLLGV
ncbi:hypothetical protein D3D03_16350 [Exiguobacterium sp. RIT452]|uniref:hypothetical protein n=1 Tax=Exiguobacterium sp. RIT452 TaxID=2315552 RepID=UPI000E70F72C|nr:hypothetical protein [Exiguobacterium sp. RIT452]RJO94687.1 hypothetical protein D3D03_16350 [Exiguobacterium sp. RIT452]